MDVGRFDPLQPRRPFLLADGSLVTEGRLLTPELLDTQGLADLSGQPKETVRGNFFCGVAPYDLCWAEAIVGCPIRWKSGHVWSEPIPESPNHLENLIVSPANPWLLKLLEVTRELVRRAQGRYPVCQPLLRGPIDILSAAAGDEPSLWAMVDEPRRFRKWLDACTDAFLTVAQSWLKASAPFHGGAIEYGLFATGSVVRTQADNAALLSPRAYREFLLPCDKRLCQCFDYPLIHTHSGGLHIMLDALLELDRLRAIQVSLDYPAGPSVAQLLPLLKQANAEKPLIITGGLSQAELDLLLETLSPSGLCLQVALHEQWPLRKDLEK